MYTCQNILNFRQNKGVNLRGYQYTLEHKRLYNASRVNYFANRVNVRKGSWCWYIKHV